MDLSLVSFKVLIHTLQLRSDEAVLDYATIRSKPYIKNFRVTDTALYTINPNKWDNSPITNINEYFAVLNKILDDLYVTKYKLVRVDIAIDTTDKFEELYKINKYVAELCAIKTKNKNTYKSDGFDLRKRSIAIKSRSFELEIYDKQIESNGKYPTQCRMEFRYMRVGKYESESDLFNKLICLLNDFPKIVNTLTENKIDILYHKWIEENKQDYNETPVNNFSEFCSKYGNEFYNSEIMKNLYQKTYGGSYENWIKNYRKKRKITFYSNRKLKTYLHSIKYALFAYLKIGAENPPIVSECKELKAG